MARPVNYLDFLAEGAPWDAPGIPPAYEDDEELEVGALFLRRMLAFAPPDEEEEEDWDDGDSGYGSCSEEDEDEDEEDAEDMVWEVEDGALEEEDDDQRFPPEEFWDGWHQRAESPVFEEERGLPSAAAALPAPSSASAVPPVGPALDFLPLGGSKRHRDEDEDAPVSKRQRSEDSDDEPAPSTSAGTSGGFRRYFHHLLQDPADAESPSPAAAIPTSSYVSAPRPPLWVLHPPPLLGRSRGSFPQRCVSYEELSMVSSTHWSEAPPEGALIQKSDYTHSQQVRRTDPLGHKDSGYGSCSQDEEEDEALEDEEEDEDLEDEEEDEDLEDEEEDEALEDEEEDEDLEDEEEDDEALEDEEEDEDLEDENTLDSAQDPNLKQH
ncbi:hypothetical protein WMY93_004285 [Mugilogobius chulae]|uniref:Uncharacterized protein n=1 Tax=Mugilogobius chulae TaxID=88201 RepID=A0AAW0PQN1_9GOBI